MVCSNANVISQGGICFCCIVYTYFRVPEPTGRTFAELDMLFEQGISARKFASTHVDAFAANVEGDVVENYKHQMDISHVERMSQGSRV